MFKSGIKASELIAELQKLIEKHGDLNVYRAGSDYPEGVHGVRYIPKNKGDAYTPGNSFEV